MNKEIINNNHFASRNLSYLRMERGPISEMLLEGSVLLKH
jgi:hypothetical protein